VSDDLDVPSRAEAKELARLERAERREKMRLFAEENKYRRMVGTVSVLMQDQEAFDRWVVEKSGVSTFGADGEHVRYGSVEWGVVFESAEKGFLRWVCGQRAAGVLARELMGHYMLDEGLLGGYLAEKPERLEMYRRAQSWAMDGYVEDVVPLADEATPEDLGVKKWQGEARMKVAAMIDPERFGKKEGGLTGALDNLSAVLQGISERKQRIQQQAVLDATVVSEQ